MSVTIEDEGLTTKPVGASRIYTFNFDDNLAEGVEIDTSTFAVVAVRPSTATLVTKDNEGIVAGNRKTQLRLSGGVLGARYRITNTVVTDQSPTQTNVKWFELLIE